MHLSRISLINFRNYREAVVDFSAKFNCFAGNNGTGKTNLLEAIYYLSFCKSFSNPVDTQNIHFNDDFFLIQGNYQINGTQDEVYCGVKRHQRKVFKQNKKEYERLSDHIGLYPLVLISPGDAQLITGGSEERRKFIDGVISQYNQQYLQNLLNYNKALTQRNALLKMFAERRKFDTDALELYDELLVQHGELLFNERWKFFKDFQPVFSEFYMILSGQAETVNLEYQSTLLEGNFRNQLIESRQDDRIAQYSTVGIHKDDLLFTIHSVPVKRYGSQGQQKTFLIALKLAQHSFTRTIKGFSPILLFDDIFDKLDNNRVEYLMKLVSSDNFGQVFVTDTNLDRLETLFKTIPGQSHVYLVGQGNVELQSTFSIP
ncbi:MAG TPA: DNA replication/repair protein RecF [Bacteroidales bacterium]|nr:DNA replication/repair protein RecF [Bacteroidales bacterium]